ncbi:head GIN domain-containing protein [Sphingobium lignivorans]|uniref:Putative auto-transporter adhesin head GIN domain-containing protein n=1 Tax=Sphingobium lignivorans TaxID=2735886 RepID=A0ABR6NJU9_9SPHN|nr:head GIN domain-containing protein [Sphingobium lignivorans]MBB5987381.1 hypothetical protein [Sphingobium lignivorans]
MNDRARLAITGAVALVALVATVGGHGLGISFGGSSDDETSEAVPEDAVRGDGAIQSLANLRDFDSVNVAGPDDVVITQGKSFSVQAEGDRRALRRLRLYVKNSTLHVEREDNSRTRDTATVRVTLPALTSISLTGPGDVRADRLVSKSARVELTGPGDLAVGRIEADDVELKTTGSGTITAGGKVRNASLSLTGSGDIKAEGLEVGVATVDILGSGDVAARVVDRAKVSVMGSGDAVLSGTTNCSISRMGSGSARCTP